MPAFSGLYAPHWNDRARGTITGLTRFSNRGHLARAVLEATAFQTWDVLEAMEKDSGVQLDTLRVDMTRPLCPYPQVAQYKGTGSTNDAANFVCKAP